MIKHSRDKINHGISIRKTGGFTIVELLVAMTISLIVMAAIFSTFKSQQDSYVVQSQVSVTQQNLRAALFMITRDIQMAGYFTDFVSGTYPFQTNGEILDGVTIRPLMYSKDNVTTIAGVKNNTDILVIIKGSGTFRELAAGEFATPGDETTASLSLNSLDTDLQYISASGHNKFGFLAKKDLNRAEIFEVAAGNNFEFPSGLLDNYSEGDFVGKVDVIIYRIEDTDSGPTLTRRNLGTDTAYNPIAEDVDNLQFSYILSDGTEKFDLNTLTDVPKIRAVKVFILARTDNKIRDYKDPNSYQLGNYSIPSTNDGYMRRLLSATVTTRNIGL